MDKVSIIKERISIIQLLQHYNIQINRAGFCICPFHNEKTPSMRVYTKTNSVYCFGGCKFSGDIIKFVQQMENTDFNGAINYIDTVFRLGLTNYRVNRHQLGLIEKNERARKDRLAAEEKTMADQQAEYIRLCEETHILENVYRILFPKIDIHSESEDAESAFETALLIEKNQSRIWELFEILPSDYPKPITYNKINYMEESKQ